MACRKNTNKSVNVRSIQLQSHIGASKFVNDDWGTVVFVIPRNQLQSKFYDSELRYNCIYFLFGFDQTQEVAYVGQAKKRNNGESVLARLREHDVSTTDKYRDIWDWAVVCTGKENVWSLDDLNALEHAFYNEINIEQNLNGNNPNSGGADYTNYIDKINQIKSFINIIGFGVFSNNNIEEITVTSEIDDNTIVEDLQNGMSSIPEIVTPHKAVSAMCDMLPAEVWNDQTVFLDPACKGGEYLREIYDRLMDLEIMQVKYPDAFERSNHILDKQLYGIALSQTSLERTTKKLKGYNHNIRVIPNYIRKLKGIELGSKPDGTSKTIQDILNEEFNKDMQFDVVIGNPPYQELTGGGSSTEVAMPLYNRFIERFLEINVHYISMIIPSRWMSGGKSVLDDMRRIIVKGKHLEKVFNYDVSTDMFKGVDIAGGVQYILLNTQSVFQYTEFHNLKVSNGILNDNVANRKIGEYIYKDSRNKEQYMIVTDNKSASIVDKVMCKCKVEKIKRFDTSVLQYRPFGLSSDFEDNVINTKESNITVICSNGRETYTNIMMITSNKDKVDKYKVCVAKVTCEHAGISTKAMNVLSKPFILKPNEVCSMTYLVLSIHNTMDEAYKVWNFIKTRFTRFLIRTTLSGMNMTSRNFIFVPYENFNSNSDIDWSKSISDIDQQLYKKYKLTQEEINYIEETIKPME